MTKPTTPKRFVRAVNRAHNIDPHHLALVILADSAERRSTLRGASYEAKVTIGARTDSQPERMLELAHPVLPVDRDNFITLDRAARRALDAVSVLNAECSDKGASWDADAWDTYAWGDMLRDATLLTEVRHAEGCEHRRQCQASRCAPDCRRRSCRCTCILENALAVGRDIDGPVATFARAVTLMAKVRRRYHRRAPTKWEQLSQAGLTADSVCDPCASVRPPVYHAAAHQERQVCRWYNDLWNRNGTRPPLELVQLKHHAPQSVYRKALSKWEDECERDRLVDLYAEGA